MPLFSTDESIPVGIFSDFRNYENVKMSGNESELRLGNEELSKKMARGSTVPSSRIQAEGSSPPNGYFLGKPRSS